MVIYHVFVMPKRDLWIYNFFQKVKSYDEDQQDIERFHFFRRRTLILNLLNVPPINIFGGSFEAGKHEGHWILVVPQEIWNLIDADSDHFLQALPLLMRFDKQNR